MRTEIVEAEGWLVEVRGRTRRTPALESEYLLSLKQVHPAMQALVPDQGKTLSLSDSHGWSLAGVASSFRYLLARCSSITPAEGELLVEPYAPAVLVRLFDQYLDWEQLPDKSDLWSQVEAVIQRMDTPVSADPKVASSLQAK